MKKQFFSNEKDGFYGTYYENPKDANCAMIGLFGDDPNDFMAKCGAKWLHKNDVNVMCMSPDVKNYGHVNFPLERIETAIKWLKSHGNKKIGIMGMSTAGMDSLVAASYFPDITLTFGLTPSDFVWQGFEQGEKDGCKEWPIPDASTLSWQGKPLAYQRVSLGEEEQGSGVKCSPGGGNGAERTLRRRGRRPDRRRVSEGPGLCGDHERGQSGVRSAEGRRTGELRQGADEKTGDGRYPGAVFFAQPGLNDPDVRPTRSVTARSAGPPAPVSVLEREEEIRGYYE